MSNTKHDLAVYIGRFQPPCNHHLETIRHGFRIAEHVLIFIGSAYGPRTIKNPFTEAERKEMILSCLTEEERKKVTIIPKPDCLYDDLQWVAGIEFYVNQVLRSLYGSDTLSTVLIGSKSDNTSWYLDKFPGWQKNFLEVRTDSEGKDLHATDVRNALFALGDWCFSEVVPFHVNSPVTIWLNNFRKTDAFKRLQEENELVKKYHESWASAPYPPTFVTVDAVVVQGPNVLLVRRGAAPGEGLLALPGGFINQKERIVDAVVRELKEETRIDVPASVLYNSIKKSEPFDHPERSLRGRTITHAFLIELHEKYGVLPWVKGGDDARDAVWVPFSELVNMRHQLFEDHWDIIHHMVGGLISGTVPVVLGVNNLNRQTAE